MEVTIIVRKTGGLWHGTIEGNNDVDERGLTADIAERKAREIAVRKFGQHSQLRYTVRRIASGD
jgi:hypothetical protein